VNQRKLATKGLEVPIWTFYTYLNEDHER